MHLWMLIATIAALIFIIANFWVIATFLIIVGAIWYLH